MLVSSDGGCGDPLANGISPYLMIQPRNLGDACRALGRDQDGRGCASCCVREFCQEQERRAALPAAAD